MADQSSKEKLVDTFLTPGLCAIYAALGSHFILDERGVLPIASMNIPAWLGYGGVAFVSSLVGNALESYALPLIPGNYQSLNVERGLLLPALTGLSEVALVYFMVPTFDGYPSFIRQFGLGAVSEGLSQYTEDMVKPYLVDAQPS